MLKQFIMGVLSSVAAYRLFPPPTNDGKSRGGGCILRFIAILIFIGLLCWAVGYGIFVAPTYTLLAIYAGLKYLAANGFIALDKLFHPGFDTPPVATWAFWGLVGGTAIQAFREMRSSGRKGMGTLAALAPILLLGLNGVIKDTDMPKPSSTKTTTAVEQNTSGSGTAPTKPTEPTLTATNQTTTEPERKPVKPIKPVLTTTNNNNTVKTPTTIPKPPMPSAPEGMVLIPAGEFQMGSLENTDEKPIHTVYTDAFYMDKYEVTNAEYKIFLNANPQWRKNRIPTVYHDGDYLQHWDGNNYPTGKNNHPVTYVSWYAAMAYAKWAGKRLPTEAEWEKAARGGLVGQKYPWGNYIDSTKANYNKNLNGTGFVGRYFRNEYGLYDMAGNVAEWCLDQYNKDFYGISPRQNPIAGGSLLSITMNFSKVRTQRVWRGGYWSVLPQSVRVADRGKADPKVSYFGIGFRCVQAVMPTMTKRTTTDTQQKTTMQRTSVRKTDISNAAPKARILEVWVDDKQLEDSVEGMRIHVKFNVHNFKDAKGRVVAYFYKENGDRLKDTNNSYYTTEGYVATGGDFQPGYVKAIYNDYTLFMPYSELHLRGKHSLKFQIQILGKNTKGNAKKTLSDASDWVSFTYTGPEAHVQKIWVDHNQHQDSVKGMRIHVKFSVNNFKDAKGKVVAYFYKENGDRLKDTNDSYNTTNGSVAITGDFQPSYVSSVYNDFKLFMPYKELHMISGKHNLKFYIKIFNSDTWDALSDSSDWVHFTYSR